MTSISSCFHCHLTDAFETWRLQGGNCDVDYIVVKHIEYLCDILSSAPSLEHAKAQFDTIIHLLRQNADEIFTGTYKDMEPLR